MQTLISQDIASIVDNFKTLTTNNNQREQVLLISDVSWSEYEQLLEKIGDISWCKVSYLDGILKIMSPSENHELIKEYLGILIEVYCDEAEIDYYPLGSTTLKQQDKSSGKEPDASYCIGSKKAIPDIAIEIVFTSGGEDDLAKYQKLEVPEVWFWNKNQLEVFSLNSNQEYQKVQNSKLLPKLDLNLLEKYLCQMTTGNPRKVKKQFSQAVQDNLLQNN